MLTSTKVALGSTLIWGALNVFKAVYAPEFDPFDETRVVVISGPMFTLLSVSQFLANILVFIALIAFGIAAMTKLKLIRPDPED
jgi:hypothetical protein